jgi:hypothetical protein
MPWWHRRRVFGRPAHPVAGGSHDVTLSYAGVRQVQRTTQVQTVLGSASETAATTMETYDGRGRVGRRRGW